MMESTRLASLLASRIFHDLVSPLTGMITGAEVAFDRSMGPAVQAEGEKLVKESLAGLDAKIQFMRFAVGASALSDGWADVHTVKSLYDKLFSIQKSKLDWALKTNYVTNRQMRVLMNMTLIMLDPVAKAGVVKVSASEDGDTLILEVESLGQPGELKLEVTAALARQEPERGWGAGIQPLFTSIIAEEIGMKLEHMSVPGGVVMTARGPKAPR